MKKKRLIVLASFLASATVIGVLTLVAPAEEPTQIQPAPQAYAVSGEGEAIMLEFNEIHK